MMLMQYRWLLAQLLIILLNPWWWLILQRNLWIGILVFSLSLIVCTYFWLKIKKLLLPLTILTLVLIFISIKDGFDESILRYSALDIQQTNKRHEFYAAGLGKAYTNRFSLTFFKDFNLPISKLQKNFFDNLDPNLYFFASHPRERLGIEEFQKFIPLFLPFFIIGILYLIYLPMVAFITYSLVISLISSVISGSYNLGPILFFPLINFIITIGFIISLKYIKLIR